MHLGDLATFKIDPTLLDGVAGKKLMPGNYYVLGDPTTMRVRQASIAVADVRISFTDNFYADPLSLTDTYVIPFRIIETSCDVVPEGRNFTLVCVNYVSSFSGTYYVRGKKVQVADAGGTATDAVPVEYYDKDISKNFTRSVVSLGLNDLRRTGIAETNASNANDRDKLRARFTLTPASSGADHDYDVAVTTGDDDAGTTAAPLPIVSGSGKFHNAPFDVYETGDQAKFTVSYIYRDGENYF